MKYFSLAVFTVLSILFLTTCEKGQVEQNSFESTEDPASFISWYDVASKSPNGYHVQHASEDYKLENTLTTTNEEKNTSTCPPDIDFFCTSNYSGSLGCFDQNGSDNLTSTFNFQFLNKGCRELFVNSQGYPVAMPNDQLGGTVNLNIVKEEINHPNCPDYTGYNVFPSDNCVNVTEAYTILDDIVSAADYFRPSSPTGYYMLQRIRVYYFEKIACEPGEGCMSTLCLDPCYCDNKRMVVKLTYREHLVGQCGTSGS